MTNIDSVVGDRNGGLTQRLRWFALVVLCLGQLMIVVDGTVVNVALPVIEVGLHFTQASLAWVVNAYLVTFGGFLLLAGRLGDLFGRKRVFLFGLILFTIASALCGLAESETFLIVARFVQGIGAAFAASMVLGILVTLFRAPVERNKAMTVYAIIGNIGGSIGLVVGGVLIEYLSWHWIFFINLPIGVAGVTAASFVIPNDAGIGIRGGVDWKGGVLAVSAPTIGVWAIVNAASVGWFTTETIGLLVLAVVLGGLFFYAEGKVQNPLVPLRVLRHRQLAAANSLRFFHGFGMSAVLFCGALYMQHVLRYSALETGLGYMALNVTIGFSSLMVVSRLIRRIGPVRPIIPGFLFIAAGLLLLARVPFDGSYVADVLPSMLLIGTGASLVFLPSVTIAMTGVRPEESGLASGLTNVTFQIGIAFGTALVASIATVGTTHALARHESAARALTAGYHLGFLTGVCGSIFGLTIAALFLQRVPRVGTSELETVAPALLAE